MGVGLWTESMVDRLRALWGKASASQIAGELGKTRNATLGKANRLGLSEPRPKSANTRPRMKRARNYFVQARPPRAMTKPKALPKEIVPPTLEMRPVTLDELNSSHCRWPVGDPCKEDFRFCGAEKDIERSYCAFHRALAYQTPQQRRTERRRELKEQRKAARFAEAYTL